MPSLSFCRRPLASCLDASMISLSLTLSKPTNPLPSWPCRPSPQATHFRSLDSVPIDLRLRNSMLVSHVVYHPANFAQVPIAQVAAVSVSRVSTTGLLRVACAHGLSGRLVVARHFRFRGFVLLALLIRWRDFLVLCVPMLGFRCRSEKRRVTAL